MAVKVWTGLGADELWSTPLNWDLAAVPVTTDTINFNGTSVKNCTIDALGTWSAGPFDVAAAYTGTITQNVTMTTAAFTFAGAGATFAQDQNLTVTTCLIGGGTFTGNSARTFTASSTFQVATTGVFNQGGAFSCTTFTIAAGTYTGSSATMSTTAVVFNNSSGVITATSGIWTLAGNLTQTNAPTFTHNSGTIDITAACTFNAPSITFNLVTINATNDNVTVSSATTMPLGANPTTVCSALATGFGLTVTGTVTASGIWTHRGFLTLGATGTVTGAVTRVDINASVTFPAASTFPTTVPFDFHDSNGTTVTATAYTFGTCTVTDATFTIAAGTTIPLGANPTTSVAGGSAAFTVTGTLTVSGAWAHTGNITVTVTTGIISGAITAISLNGSLTFNTAANVTTGIAVTFGPGGSTTVTATGYTFGTCTITKTGGAFTFTIAAGTTIPLGTDPVTNVGGTTTINGTVTVSGTWTHTAGNTVSLNSGGEFVGTFVFKVIDQSVTVNAAFTWPATGGFESNRTNGNTINFTGASKTYASFRRSGAGTGQVVILGTNTFTLFRDNDGLVAHILTFPNVTTTIGTWIVSGVAGKLVTIQRTGGAGTFTLTGTTINPSNYLSISNSTVDASPAWYAGANSTNGGGNTNWIFTAPPNIAKYKKSAALV